MSCPYCGHEAWEHSIDAFLSDGWIELFCTRCSCAIPQARLAEAT